MTAFLFKPCTAFAGGRLLAAGPLLEVALAVKTAIDGGAAGSILTFDDGTGAVVDFDLRGSKADIINRLSEQALRPAPAAAGATPASACHGEEDEYNVGTIRGRGRPRLGVIAREVTLLPRHWEWLAMQRGGASATLRRLVDTARRVDGGKSQARAAQEAAYRFMAAMAGDRPGFEAALRALFAGHRQHFERAMAAWPADLRAYALKLASDATADPR